jgi:hypothetical protein
MSNLTQREYTITVHNTTMRSIRYGMIQTTKTGSTVDLYFLSLFHYNSFVETKTGACSQAAIYLLSSPGNLCPWILCSDTCDDDLYAKLKMP